jgi:nicotinamidase-related amidase
VPTLELDRDTTALILIDFTNGLLGADLAPHSGEAVLAKGIALADAFRAQGCAVVLTANAPPSPPNPRGEQVASLSLPVTERDVSVLAKMRTIPNFGDIATDLGPKDGDLVIRKSAWSAFFATDLDVQLRRRGVRTLVLGGIATNFGAESTARDARAHGYNVVFAQDAARALTADEHEHSCTYTFPMIGRVRTTDEILTAIG